MPILNLLKKIVVALAIPALAPAADVLTLEQAVAMAIEHNRSMLNSTMEIQKAQDRLNASRTRQFPNVNLYVLGSQQLSSFNFTLEKGVLGTYSGTGPLPAEDVHLSTPLEPTGFVHGTGQPAADLADSDPAKSRRAENRRRDRHASRPARTARRSFAR